MKFNQNSTKSFDACIQIRNKFNSTGENEGKIMKISLNLRQKDSKIFSVCFVIKITHVSVP